MNDRPLFLHLLCAGVFLFCSYAISAAPPSYSSRLWQTEEGLPHNTVQSIAQTADGYLWVGTRYGLARFDGARFVRFGPDNVPELKNASVLSLCASRDGTLWIGTEGGGVAQFKEGRFSSLSLPHEGSYPVVRAMHEAADDSMWIGNYGRGLTRLKNGNIEYFTRKEGLADDTVRFIFEDRQNSIWVATIWGLTRFADGNTTNFTEENGLKHNSVRAVCEDRAGNIWIGSNGGLTWLRDGAFTHYSKKDGLSDNVVSALHLDRNDVMWIGTYEGLTRFENSRFATINRDDGEPFSQVYSIFEDREQNLWVGTKEGLIRLRARSFLTYTKRDGLTHNTIASVFEDRSGTLWIGTGGGLNFLRNGTIGAYTITNGLRSDLVRGIHEGKDGSLWFGTWYDGGLNRLNEERFTFFGRPELWDSPENVIHEDRSGNLWLGSPFALNRYKGGKFTRYDKSNGLPDEDILSLCEDHEGALWIGTGNGLTRWREGQFSRQGFELFAGRRILALYEDQQQALWISIEGQGLARYQAGVFTHYTTRDGLFTDVVFEILEDGHGFFWFASPKGVFRISKKDLDSFQSKKINAIPCTVFGKDDGMASAECQNIAKPAACRSRDGRLWFSTIKGLSVVDPSKIEINDSLPPVVIEAVVADKKLVVSNHESGVRNQKSMSSLAISPGRGELEIHYAALSYAAPEKNRFKYRLEGLDADWIDAGNRRDAFYNNVPPGDYTFRVTACNNDGVWNSVGASVKLSLQPHIWQTWWAKLFVVCAGVVLVAGGARFVTRRRMQLKLERLEQQHAVARERGRIAQDLHDDLGARLSEILILSNLPSRGEPNASDLARQLNRVSTTARSLVDNLDAIVWAVNPKNDSFDRLVFYLCEYAPHYLEAASIRCRFDVPQPLPTDAISSVVRHGLFLVLKEALHNVVKHAKATEVKIAIRMIDGRIHIEISDNGKGFEAGKTSSLGNGLLNMEDRIGKMGGRFLVKSELGKGTHIRMEVPVFVRG